MASGSTSSLLGSSDETFNGMKLMRLILDGGTEALRNVFQRIHPGNLQVVLSCKSSFSTCTLSTCNYHCLSDLKTTRKIIRQNQWDKLYPPHPNNPNINDFDITLLSVLLRNICGLSPPSTTGWDNMPTLSDLSVEADIVRIKLFRNEHFGHRPQSAVSEADFKALWAEISLPLVRLGIDQKEIDRLENEECGEEDMKRIWNALEEYRNVLNETRNAVEENTNVLNETRNAAEENRNVLNETRNALGENTNALNETRNTVEENRNVLSQIRNDIKKLRPDDLLKKYLVQFNFQTEIDFLNGKCTRGSREWVLEQVRIWFNKTTSENRAFVISDHAGMGKSVIAAVVCRRFAEHIGASHFFKYNDSQHNNPNFFLQSVAWHLCKVIPAYKEALIQKLSGNLENPLNDMNIQGLFSILFKEPFSGISDPGKHILIVLDAVDESEYKGRHEIAELFFNRFDELPSYLRFLITTRREKNLFFAFRELKLLSMQANDKENLHDIKLVLQDKIPSSSHRNPDFIDSLAQKCDGSMLYAFILAEMYKENISIHTIESLPGHVEECYAGCFKRLERELLQLVGISGDRFLSFLSALAVAKEPLPEAFLGTLFGFENPADAMDKVANAIIVPSSLLVVKKDKCISFFHKSIRDWLLDPCREHYHHVNVQYGHKILFKLCVKEFDELKRKGVSKERVTSAIVSYALKYWIPHMLDGLEDAEKLEGFVDSYLIDLEVMFANVLVDVNVALINFRNLESHEMFDHMSATAIVIVKKLYSLIRKFGFSLQEYPQTFLQNVVNEGGEQLSSKASDLLQTRYKDFFYFQLDKHDREDHAIEARYYLSGTIQSIDVSPNHDYVVCGYKDNGIELFSLTTGMSEWKKPNLSLRLPSSYQFLIRLKAVRMLARNIVFHPRENLIFPSSLDRVLTLQGEFTTGPFHSDENSSVFSNCCFSADGSKMVTQYGNRLFVWNVSNGCMERRILTSNQLLSLSFAANGNYLGTTACNVFSVYDVKNDYQVNETKIEVSTPFPVEIVCTFDHNSWLCSVDNVLRVVSHDLVLSPDSGSLRDIAFPSNDHSSRELQRFLQQPEESWLLKVRKDVSRFLFTSSVHRYILIGDKNLLFFSCDSDVMSLFSIEGFVQTEQAASNVVKHASPKISSNGDFVYLSRDCNFTVCKLPLQDKYSRCRADKLDFLVVRDGVIFYSEGHACIPELWNSDVTECLSSFDQLNDTTDCLSVSDEVIACVCHQTESNYRIIFFNVSTKEIVKETSVTLLSCVSVLSRENDSAEKFKMGVVACSVKYHVLTQDAGGLAVWKDGKRENDWINVFCRAGLLYYTSSVEFSPEGNNLAISCLSINEIWIFHVDSKSVLARITIPLLQLHKGMLLLLKFFDSENLICGSRNNNLFCININSRKILTCLDVGDKPSSISVCRERNIVCVGLDYSKNFKLVTVCPPRRLHTSLDLMTC